MEKVGKRDMMIRELIEGIEAAKELQKRILISPAKANYHHHDNPELKKEEEDNQALNHSLLDKMLSAFDKTIFIAKLINLELQQLPDDHDRQQPNNNDNSHFDEGSPTHSLGLSSPRSENSHHQPHLPKKKRKMMPSWSKWVNVGSGGMVSGLDGPLEDGFCWRKYGQKEILGAKHPRGYYRCTHRKTQGCAALKHVQRSDEEPFIFHVTYRGEHTCTPGPHLSKAQFAASKTGSKSEPKPQSVQSPPQAQQQIPQSPEQEVYLGLGPNNALKIEVEPTENENPTQIFRSFSFSPSQLESGPIENFLLDCSPLLGSPATSGSNYFAPSLYQVTGPGAGLNAQTSESDLNGSISGPNSVSNSPIGCDFEFPIDQLLDIEADYPNFEF